MSTIAIFDFDGTLAIRDSLWPYLLRAAGPLRCAAAVLAAVKGYVLAPKGKDRRTAIKENLLRVALSDISLVQASRAGARMRHWPKWIESTVSALKNHHAQGHHVLIATGSLDLYIEDMLADIPHDAVLCTVMEKKDGFLTGHMLSGNCVRQRKAQLVGEYLAKNGPYDDVWVYGNAPHDLPMMEWAQHKIII